MWAQSGNVREKLVRLSKHLMRRRGGGKEDTNYNNQLCLAGGRTQSREAAGPARPSAN